MAGIKQTQKDILSYREGYRLAKENGREADASDYWKEIQRLHNVLLNLKDRRRRLQKERSLHLKEARRFREAIDNEDPKDRSSWKEARREALRNALEQYGRISLELDDIK